jgi:hypothetical protein
MRRHRSNARSSCSHAASAASGAEQSSFATIHRLNLSSISASSGRMSNVIQYIATEMVDALDLETIIGSAKMEGVRGEFQFCAEFL